MLLSLEYGLAFLDRLQHLNVFDRHWGYLERILDEKFRMRISAILVQRQMKCAAQPREICLETNGVEIRTSTTLEVLMENRF